MCEEYNHWAELVFLYVQYDEYDNAALIMIAHSPTAWEHTHFKDVLVKVRNTVQLWVAPGGSVSRSQPGVSLAVRPIHGPGAGAQVSNVEVYYKAISFYLAAHPSLLVDMLKVEATPALLNAQILKR